MVGWLLRWVCWVFACRLSSNLHPAAKSGSQPQPASLLTPFPMACRFAQHSRPCRRRGINNCQTNFDPSQYKLDPAEPAFLTDANGCLSFEAAAAVAAAALGVGPLPLGAMGHLRLGGQPSRSSSLYRGVRWHERNNKWEARIFDGVKQRSLGEA